MAGATATSRIPVLASLEQVSPIYDCGPISVVATFFQPRRTSEEDPDDHDDEEVDQDEEEIEVEDCEIDFDSEQEPETDDNNNRIEVTIPIRVSRSPEATPVDITTAEATIVRHRSTSAFTDIEAANELNPPEIVIDDVDSFDDEASTGDSYDNDQGKHFEQSPGPDDSGSFLSVEHRKLERRISRSAELEPDELESKINEYDRISTVGTGSFGRVILVQHRESGSYFALKMMGIREVIRNRQIEHVHSEKNILLGVDHPFVIKLHWAYHDSKFLYMLFDYVPGGELFSYLRSARRFSNDTARFYTAEIVLAIEYLHSVHVVYRDLKPENILLDKDGHVRLTDFGFAKQVTEGRTFTMCGTPEYLAPEIVAGKGHNAAVDWWSLGILVYEMMVGRTPFPGEESRVVYSQILERKPKFTKGFDPAAKDLIRRLLVVNRVKRLGNLKGGADDIKAHMWFSDINWRDVYDKKLQPPIRPTVNGEGDTGNFDEYDEDDASQTSEATPDDLELFEDW